MLPEDVCLAAGVGKLELLALTPDINLLVCGVNIDRQKSSVFVEKSLISGNLISPGDYSPTGVTAAAADG